VENALKTLKSFQPVSHRLSTLRPKGLCNNNKFLQALLMLKRCITALSREITDGKSRQPFEK